MPAGKKLMSSTLTAAQRYRSSRQLPNAAHDTYPYRFSRSLWQSKRISRCRTWLRLWGRHHIAQYVGVYAKLANWAAHAGIVRERIHVIDNAIDFRRFDFGGARLASRRSGRQFAIPDELSLGVVVGNIRPDKGVDVLLNALALSRHRGAFKIVADWGRS